MRIADEKTWPKEVVEYLDRHGNVFRAWEARGRSTNSYRVSGAEYDRTVYGLRALLQRYSLHGYHCTRLTEREIDEIITNGMRVLSGDWLRARIEALVADRLITRDFGQRLLSDHQADEPNRAGMIWFCFFPPRKASEYGIGRFLRYWGGESLYMSHQDGNGTPDERLAAFGTPCLVEADVPIRCQNPHSDLETKVARSYLKRRGFRTRECCDHENCATVSIPPTCIRRVIPFPSYDFRRLSGCDSWDRPLSRVANPILA